MACLSSLLLGFGVGWSLPRRTVVVRGEVAAPLAPEMTVTRFLSCSEAAPGPELSEAQWDALKVRWALRHWRPEGMDWPAP